MGRHKLEPYVIQKAQFAKKFLAILITEKNINDVNNYINGYFCRDSFVLCNEELFVTTIKNERIAIHIGDYFIMTDELDIFCMKENVFKKLFIKEENKKK